MSEINVERLEPYKPPFSVWELIKSTVPEKELLLVKSYLGESLIEYCLDLRNELETLLDIWTVVGEQVEPPTITQPGISKILPDPPHLRDILIKEIHLLVKDIQEKNGNLDQQRYDKTDKKVIQYAMIAQSSTHDLGRPSTPMRRPEKEAVFTSPVKLKHIKRNIGATNIDVVAPFLQDAIEKECRALEKDIKFLQNCVEEEHNLTASRPTSPIEEPSIGKLRQVCKSLEAKVMTEPFNLNHPTTPSTPIKLPTPPSPNRVQLKPIETNENSLPKVVIQSKNQPPLFAHSLKKSLRNGNELDPSTSQKDPHSVSESWFEPEWSLCMSDSPPTTADSGISSRPATCDISALQERRHGMLVTSITTDRTENKLPFKAHQLPADNGYQTSSSTDLANETEIPQPEETIPQNLNAKENVTDQHKTSTNSLTSQARATSISPCPPKREAVNLSRRAVNNRRYSRRPVET